MKEVFVHPRPGWFRVGTALVALLLAILTIGVPAINAGNPVVDVPAIYLPLAVRNQPLGFPPPLEAAMSGWLRKWWESESLPRCLEAAGTPYYLEVEPGMPSWAAAVAATDAVAEDRLELAIDSQVYVRGVAEYFDPDCAFPRLEVRELQVISGSPGRAHRHEAWIAKPFGKLRAGPVLSGVEGSGPHVPVLRRFGSLSWRSSKPAGE